MDRDTQLRYSRIAIVLHWLIAALILSTIPLGLYGASSDSAQAQAVTNFHKTVGIAILFFTVIRVVWRLTHRPPALPASMGKGLRVVARATHGLLYAFMLIMPLSGWWMSSAVPDRHTFGIGGFDIPFLPVPRGWASAGPAHFVHTTLAWAMIGLVVLHILAALKHHFINRDTVLTRMLPTKA